jgi:hypothetical protein
VVFFAVVFLLDFFAVDVAVVAIGVVVSCMTGAVELADIVLVSADIAAADVSVVVSAFLEQPPSATPARTSTAIAAPSLKVPLTLPPLCGRAAKNPVNSIAGGSALSGLAATTVPIRAMHHDHLISAPAVALRASRA